MDIIVYLGLFLVSILPSIILYKWFNKQSDDEKYKVICKDALIKGILAVFPILLTSLLLNVFCSVVLHSIKDTLLYKAFYTFFVLAFAEELVKYLAFKKLIKKFDYNYSWFNLTIFMTIVGLGFGCIENTVMTIGSNFIMMVIRGISIGHAGYGFIMGWFYGKMLKTKKKIYGVLGFVIPWILHGLYDFGLTEELLSINDNYAIISVSLELLCIIFVFIIIHFVRKRRKDKIYINPVNN